MQKRTKVLTNSVAIFEALNGKFCCKTHQHEQIQGSEDGIKRSQWAQVYPEAMVTTICEAVLRSVPRWFSFELHSKNGGKRKKGCNDWLFGFQIPNMKILAQFTSYKLSYHLFGMMVASVYSNTKLNEGTRSLFLSLCQLTPWSFPNFLACRCPCPQSLGASIQLLECWSTKRLSSQTGEPPKENPPMKWWPKKTLFKIS